MGKWKRDDIKGKNNPAKRKDVRLKLSLNHRRYQKLETREKIREPLMGRKLTEEHKEKLTELFDDGGRYKRPMGVEQIPDEFETLVRQDFTGIKLNNGSMAEDLNQPSRLLNLPKWEKKFEKQKDLNGGGLSLEDELILKPIVSSSERLFVIYKYLVDANILKDEYIVPNLTKDGSIKFSMLTWEKIYPDLEHKDVVGIQKTFYEFKKMRVEKIIDMFAHPTDYLMPDGSTIKDHIWSVTHGNK